MCRLPSYPPGVWRMPVSDGGSMNPEAGFVVSWGRYHVARTEKWPSG